MSVQDIILVQKLDGRWETLGADTGRGITPIGVTCSVDQAGPRDLSFSLSREADVPWLDLSAYTPIEYHPDGLLVWSGRIRDTPTDEQLAADVITVNCVGWQYHMDDDKLNRIHVHTRLSDYRDMRSYILQNLTRVGTAAAQVTVGDGGIVVGWAKGAQIGTTGVTNPYAGAYLDLGPDNTAARVVLTYKRASGTAPAGGVFGFAAKGTDSPLITAAGEDIVAVDLSTVSTSDTTAALTFTTPRRYVQLWMYYFGSGALTTAEENLIQVSSVKCFSSTTYESGNASILKASTVARDVRQRVLPLLSASDERVTQDPAAFSIPEFLTRGASSPREIIEAANAFMDYRIGVDEQRRLVFGPRPTVAEVETLGEFDDASANSGDDIFNRVILEGTGPDGEPVVVSRFTGQATPVIGTAATGVSIPNPSFETGGTPPSGWSELIGTVTQDATTAAAGANSGKLTTHAASAQVAIYSALSGMTPGLVYVVSFWVRRLAAWNIGTLSSTVRIKPTAVETTYAGYGQADFSTFTVGAWQRIVYAFRAEAASMYLHIGADAGVLATPILNVDNIEFFHSGGSLPDRRGFTRTAHLPIQSALPAAALQVIGDLWLAAHTTTPLKGAAKILPGDARTVLGGRDVKPAEMLLRWGERLRLARSRSPDTGASHREGVIAAVTYTSADDTAQVSIDSEQKRVEAFLARLDVVTGQRG